jgi:hypothetical protein
VDTGGAADYQALHDQLEVEIADLRAVVDLEVTRARVDLLDTVYADVERRVFVADLDAQRAWTAHRAEMKERIKPNGSLDRLASHDELTRRRELHALPPDHPAARREPWRPDQLIPSIDELCRRPSEGWWSR